MNTRRHLIALPLVATAVILLSSCSKPSAEEYYAMGEAAAASNPDSALYHFTNLVEEYPTSPFAESAQFLIGSIHQNSTRNYRAAVSAYQSYLDLFPDGKQVATATFLLGFLYNNELQALDSAAMYYRMFLDRYPDNEMASSAQFELENLGKPPEELIPRDEVAADVPVKKEKKK